MAQDLPCWQNFVLNAALPTLGPRFHCRARVGSSVSAPANTSVSLEGMSMGLQQRIGTRKVVAGRPEFVLAEGFQVPALTGRVSYAI